MNRLFVAFENFNKTSVIRFFSGLVLKMLGVSNIRFILTYQGPRIKNDDSFNDVVTIESANTLTKYVPPKRLKKSPLDYWFSKGSKLHCIVRNNMIVSYIWTHYNFDPNKELTDVQTQYVRTGPSFVKKAFRGKGHAKKIITKIIASHDIENQKLCSIISYNNVSSILYNVKMGYGIHKVIYKTKKGRFVF